MYTFGYLGPLNYRDANALKIQPRPLIKYAGYLNTVCGEGFFSQAPLAKGCAVSQRFIFLCITDCDYSTLFQRALGLTIFYKYVGAEGTVN